MLQLQIRRATVQDAEGLRQLNDLFNGENCHSVEAIAESLQFNEQEIVCVAEQDQKLVGFCCAQLFKSMCYSVNYAEITELFVLEAYRRARVGGQLLSYTEKEFESSNVKGYQLFTGKDNLAAQKFYLSCGYTSSTEMMFRKQI